MKRSAGILLPIFSLPSPYGIGTMGKAAYCFIDFLLKANQSWWQILPLGPTNYGDSPYQSFSSFAGNPYFIDLELLQEEGLLEAEDLKADWGKDPAKVDYKQLYAYRVEVLQRAMRRGWKKEATEIERFSSENSGWLGEYSLFMALKRHFGMLPWTEWEEDIRLRKPEALERYRQMLAEDIRLFIYIQYLFFKQWNALKKYANERGIGIIGDIPIYVAMDSADVWAEPQWFQLDEKNRPLAVAGVPPDAFSADGQLWGNPLYDWDKMKADGYGWWIRRIDGAAKLYDVIRIDHFRGFESYWAVPYGAETAKAGQWRKGAGLELITVLKNWFPQVSYIAEDLGFQTQEVQELLRASGFPGMKVLEFAFDSREANQYLPHTYEKNCICYIGTHDNAPVLAWLEEADPADIVSAKNYLALGEDSAFHWELLRCGMASVADGFIAQIQDYLGLGAESRINTPGSVKGNWQWRLLEGQLTDPLAWRIAEMTWIYGRGRA